MIRRGGVLAALITVSSVFVLGSPVASSDDPVVADAYDFNAYHESGGGLVTALRVAGYDKNAQSADGAVGPGSVILDNSACAGSTFRVAFRVYARSTGAGRTIAGTFGVARASLDGHRTSCPVKQLKTFRPTKISANFRATNTGRGCEVLSFRGPRSAGQPRGVAGTYTVTIKSASNFTGISRYVFTITVARASKRHQIRYTGKIKLDLPPQASPCIDSNYPAKS